MPSVAQAVWKLRSQIRPGDVVHQLDLAKAFYRITTIVKSEGERVPLLLKIGNSRYISDRLVFGLSCGPQGLVCSQLIIQTLVHECARILFGDAFNPVNPIVAMDDFLFTGAAGRCSRTIRLYDVAWGRTGFECPKKKRDVWSEERPVRWLGQHYTWTSSSAKISMRRSAITFTGPKQWTKRQAFRAAGQFTSNTNCLSEALARVHADCIRAIAGKTPEWDKKLDKVTCKAITYHYEQGLSKWDNARVSGEDEAIPLLNDYKHIDLFTDASATGMGMVISANGKILFAEGKLFKAGSKSWHVNRRELYALATAVLKTDTLIQGMNISAINAHTDSRVARAQTDPWRNVSSKSLERQVLMRLKNCIIEISSFWKLRNINFNVQYIQGETNVHADALSRVRSNGPSIPDENNEINIIDVSYQIDEIRGFDKFKEWLIKRQLFFGWKKESDNLIDDPAAALRLFIKHHQEDDPLCKRVTVGNGQGELKHYCVDADGVIMRKAPRLSSQIVIPEPLIADLMTHIHKQTGHSSPPATLAHFFKACYHPKARKIMKKVFAKCDGCNRASGKESGQTQFGHVTPPLYPFHTIGIDLYGPLQRGQGSSSKMSKKSIVTICDRLTGWTQFRVVNNAKSQTVARCVEEFLYQMGPRVRAIFTDGGPQFAESPLIPAICKMWGIQQFILPPYTPHLGGFYEIRHKTATSVLRAILAEQPIADWQTMANIAAAKINSHIGQDRSHSPHELIFGWSFSFPSTSALMNAAELRPVKPDDALFEAAAEEESRTRLETRQKMIEIWTNEYIERQNISAERFRQQLPKNREELQVGDKVYFVKQIITRKFGHKSLPYRLVERLGESIWKAESIDEPGKIVKVHSRHLRKAEEAEDATRSPATADQVDQPEALAEQAPPVRKSSRTAPENRFLSSIQGQLSRSGRVRRGSYVQ
jgi:hypothetical protein